MRIVLLFLISVCIITVFSNLTRKIPRIPGDVYLDKFGFNIHIPFVSALVLTVALTIFFNFFQDFGF